MAKKIAITNEKGGCGKTTTSVNLSSMLAERGYKTLIIDADPQSYATHYFNYYHSTTNSIFDVLIGNSLPMEVIVHTNFFGLDLLPANSELRNIEEILTKIKFDEENYQIIMKKQLEILEDNYDYIIIDCPPQGYKLQENIETYVDYVVLPMIPDEYTLHSLLVKAEVLQTVKKNINPRLSILGALVIMDEKRDSTKNAYKEALFSQTLFPMFQTTIRKNTTLARAINAHEPINVFNKRSNGNLDYQFFTDELVRRIN